MFKVKVTVKVQNVSEYLLGQFFSELRTILYAILYNLVCLCSIISQSVVQKNWFTVFNIKVTARADITKI